MVACAFSSRPFSLESFKRQPPSVDRFPREEKGQLDHKLFRESWSIPTDKDPPTHESEVSNELPHMWSNECCSSIFLDCSNTNVVIFEMLNIDPDRLLQTGRCAKQHFQFTKDPLKGQLVSFTLVIPMKHLVENLLIEICR